MSTKLIKGDMFGIAANIRINTVNCVGVMGKGIALQFRERYPLMYLAYKDACDKKKVKIGHLYQWCCPTTGETILNFPTKDHWRNPSRYEYIEQGLLDLVDYLDGLSPMRITCPALGCGNGGLSWPRVRQMIRDHFDFIDHTLYLFEPK